MRAEFSSFWHGLCLNYVARARRDGTKSRPGSSFKTSRRNPGVFQLNDEGMHMPAFTFEKISPPVRRGPIPSIEKKQHGVIVQILDRFVEARVKRTLRVKKKGVLAVNAQAVDSSIRSQRILQSQNRFPLLRNTRQGIRAAAGCSSLRLQAASPDKPAGAVRRDHALGLVPQQPRENNERRWRQMMGHRRRHLAQGIGENVRQHQVERRMAREFRR